MFKIISCLLLLVTNFAIANDYRIERGSLHTGGLVKSSIKEHQESGKVIINIQYNIKAKPFVPVPREYLSGNYEQVLPESFLDETTYLQLEVDKSMKIDEATVYHIGRADVGRYLNSHVIKIVADNGRSEMKVYYHPAISEMGWAKVILLVKNIPLIGNYTINAELID